MTGVHKTTFNTSQTLISGVIRYIQNEINSDRDSEGDDFIE